MLLVELQPLEESGLKGTKAGRLALAVLKAVGADQPLVWLRFRTILRDVCRNLRPEGLRRELRRALYYLMSVMEPGQEVEVRQALRSIQDEFLPVKENIVTLLEHLEKRGKVETLIRLLSAAFPESSSVVVDRVRRLPDETLDQLTDVIALRRPWAEIEELLRRAD